MRNQKMITERWNNLGLMKQIKNKDHLANYYETLLDISVEYNRRRGRGDILESFETAIFPAAYRICLILKKIPIHPMNLFNGVKKFIDEPRNIETIKELAMGRDVDVESEMVAIYCNGIIENYKNKN